LIENLRSTLPPASATPEPHFEVENLCREAERFSSAFGVNSATWWQGSQWTFAKSPELDPPRLLWRSGVAEREALGDDPLAQRTGVLPMAIVDLRTDNDGKRLGHCRP
jgi:hypothetical protein